MSTSAPTDNDVRLAIYRNFLEHGRAPAADEVAAALAASVRDIEASYRRLHESHGVPVRRAA